MSARIPVRRLGQSACAAFRPRSPHWISARRAFSNSPPRFASDADKKDIDLSNPLLENYLDKHRPGARRKRPVPTTGDLSPYSIFKPEYELRGYHEGEDVEAIKEANKKREEEQALEREKELHALTLDPAPEARRKFERKLVIRSLEKRRVSKTLRLKRTEREMTYKSQPFPTSTKKMTRLMRQIQGKTLEEALIQMRFSKKRVARDIVKGLQLARDEAIAARGMGLGAGGQRENSEIYLADGTRIRHPKGKGVTIELKDGTKKRVSDPTEIYIDQAWASKGQQSRSTEYRARGKVNLLTHRTARFNVLLKEEKTRIRISDEINKKRENRPLWLPLRDRPVTAQRQYCLW